MTKPPIAPWLTQTGSIYTVAMAIVGTVTFPFAILPKESFWASVSTGFPMNPWGALASPSQRVTGASILTVTDVIILSHTGLWETSFITKNASPAIGTRTPTLSFLASASIHAVLTAQTAFVSEGVI